ncbi:MAG: (d)CMP kinase [Oligoflexia bacterium]|nr:(d)CMP kinase [Oligoflexia bacterium]
MVKVNDPIVAIDGPAGSGKSTIAKLLAKRLGFRHIDTGALYRAVALLSIESKVDLSSEIDVVRSAKGKIFSFVSNENENRLEVNNRNVSPLIRTEEVSRVASVVSAYPGVRHLLLDLQRSLGESGGVVLEGRDIGTVVFPNAEAKIFLTATVEERAHRRWQELMKKNSSTDLEEVKKDLIIRDAQDSNREHAPLKKAADAIEFDTTGLSIETVLDRLESIVRSCKKT